MGGEDTPTSVSSFMNFIYRVVMFAQALTSLLNLHFNHVHKDL